MMREWDEHAKLNMDVHVDSDGGERTRERKSMSGGMMMISGIAVTHRSRIQATNWWR